MSEKKAFVFDTNFIKQNMDLKSVIDNLKDNYVVYVSQVSIEERIGQRCREDRQSYAELEEKSNKYERFAKIEYSHSIDEYCKMRRQGILKNYSRIFNDNIVPIPYSQDLLESALKRACDKLPPFSSDQKASDKGFKDYLLWASIIGYFKEIGENEIVFLTDDKGFLENKEWLSNEFYEATEKNIEIKSNNYYRELISDGDVDYSSALRDVIDISNIKELRNDIENTFYSICQTESFDDFGFPKMVDTFKTHVLLLPEDTEIILNRLPYVVSKHIFEKQISVYEIFDINPGDIIGYYSVDIETLEKAIKLYSKIKDNYSSFLDQFFTVATNILNRNYETIVDDDDELPF